MNTMSTLDLTSPLLVKAMSQFQIVVVDTFYDVTDQTEAMNWLGRLFRFKVHSYQASYPYGILPFGATDLIGTHWILCRKQGSELEPVMGFKTIDSHRTDLFRMEFPALGMVSDPGQEEHRAAIEYQLKKARQEGYGLGFLGSWTAAPELRQDPIASKLYKKVSAALYTQWIRSFDVKVAVTFAIMRFQVEKFHSYLGMKRLLGANGQPLPEFTPSPTFGELTSASILYREDHSEASIRDSDELAALWEKRMIIASEKSPLWQRDPLRRAA
jgi:hypothetical protein